MKKAFIFAAMVAAITLTACQKDDSPVDMSQLVGRWHETEILGGGDNYIFDEDGGYKRSEFSITSVDEPTRHWKEEGKYEISTGDDNKIITLFREGSDRGEQFRLLELNSREMIWEELIYGAGEVQKFERSTD